MMTYAHVAASQLWSRHRWGWCLLLTWLFGTALTWQLIGEQGRQVALVPLAILPFGFFYLYLIATLGYSFDSDDISGRRSCFPSRLFLLPVPTHQLVLWPLLYGAIITAALWTLVHELFLRPARMDGLWWWGPLQLMTMLAWIQALLWSRSRLPQLRLFLIFGVLMFSGAIHVIYKEMELTPGTIAGFLIVMLILAWVTAWRGVAQARSEAGSESWEWGEVWDLFRFWSSRGSRPFPSEVHAQRWLDFKLLGGESSPLGGCLMMLVTLPVAGGLQRVVAEAISADMLPNLRDVRPEVSALTYVLAVILLWIPLVLVGTFHPRTCYPSSQRLRPMSLFYATRPQSNVELVTRKHQSTWRSAILNCALGTLALFTYVWLTGRIPLLQELRQHRWAGWETWEVVLFLIGLLLCLILLTWTIMITGFSVSMTGRPWLIGVTLLTLGVVAVALSWLTYWLTFSRPDLWAPTIRLAPWLLCGLLMVKLWLGWITLRELRRREWITRRRLVTGMLIWGTTTATLTLFIRWSAPAGLVSWSHALLVVAVVVPWSRVWAAPLMLAWNRHR